MYGPQSSLPLAIRHLNPHHPPMSDPIKNTGRVVVGKMKITDGERAKRKELTRAPKPRLASTLVLTCGSGKNLKILMGQRSKRHDFMPSVYVFPGGRVDRADSFAKYAGDLSPRTTRIMEAAYPPRRARAVALASVRETWEETGLMLGAPSETHRNLSNASYDAFRAKGSCPTCPESKFSDAPSRRHIGTSGSMRGFSSNIWVIANRRKSLTARSF